MEVVDKIMRVIIWLYLIAPALIIILRLIKKRRNQKP